MLPVQSIMQLQKSTPMMQLKKQLSMRQKANAHAVCLISLETLTHEKNCHVPHADMNVKVVWSMLAEASEIHSNTQTRHRGGTVASSLHLSSYCQTNKVSAVLSSNMPVLSALSWPRAPSFIAWSPKNKRIFEDISLSLASHHVDPV